MEKASAKIRERGEAAGSGTDGHYYAGIYTRLSVDSGNGKNESIGAQREIAMEYIRGHREIELYRCYSDLGKTGVDFEREGFKRMLADIRGRRINCVIVKDFSRFGRNYIETGNYIQNIFPFLGVRFIAVTDGFDSLEADSGGLSVNLRNLANEMYARDIGIKVKSSLAARREAGDYIGGTPPYGYRAARTADGRRLAADAAVSGIVGEIFRRCCCGSSYKEIAGWLYGAGIHRPVEYRRYGHPYRLAGEPLAVWSRGTLGGLLSNPVYMGALPGPDGILLENSHEPLVERKLFFEAAEVIRKRSLRRGADGAQDTALAVKGGTGVLAVKGGSEILTAEGENGAAPSADVFAGMLFCGECGHGLVRSSSVKESRKRGKRRLYYYDCPNAAKADGCAAGTSGCRHKYISERTLYGLFMEAAGKEFGLSGIVKPRAAGLLGEELERERAAADRERLKLVSRLEAVRLEGSRLYLEYREGTLGRGEFEKRQAKNRRELTGLSDSIARAEEKIAELNSHAEKKQRLLRRVFKFDGSAEPDGELLRSVADRICVYPDKRVGITFRFESPFAERK